MATRQAPRDSSGRFPAAAAGAGRAGDQHALARLHGKVVLDLLNGR
jgi:hypothetical protein